MTASARLIESDDDKKAWHEISESAVAGQMHQCYWWAEPLKKTGVRPRGIGFWKGSRLVGGALFRSIPVPYVGAHLTQCLAGPLHLDWDPEWADHFVAKVDEMARADNSIEVAIHGCVNRELHRDIAFAFMRRGLPVGIKTGPAEAVVPLKGATLDGVWKGMSDSTRRNIRKGQKHAVEVRELTTGLELRLAHDAWLATASRKGFSDVRPWDLLEPVLRECIDRRLGKVYASFLGDRMLAAIFVTFIGGQASYVYGGFVDGAEAHAPNHLLHAHAIKECLEKGLRAYNLGQLTRTFDPARPVGIDQFKLGFGARIERRPDSIIWKRMPVVAAGLDWLRDQKAGKRIAEELKRRLLSKKEEAREG
jgi:hypothetical protein